MPQPNQWSSIFISDSGEADFEFCWFRYGGGEHSGIVDTYTSDVGFTHCSFFYSGENGIYANKSSFKVENCNFHKNNNKGIHFEGTDGTKPIEIINTAFTNSNWAVYANLNGDTLDLNLDRSLPQGTTESGFARNGFGLAGNVSGNSKISGQDQFPIIIWETLTVNNGSSLELSPGTVVKFNDFWDHIVVNGSFIAEGTPQDHIYFTSLNDDCIEGDTNGDDSLTEAAPNQWAAVWITDQSTYASISYAEFYYGSGASNSMLTVDNNTSIEKSIFGNTNQNGIEFRSGNSTITNSIIHDNASGIAVTGDATVNISDCVFNHNTNWGVWAENQLDCGENYWGASTGPSNANSNPDGTGDRINDNVNCNQWLQSVPAQDLIEYPVFEATVYGKEVSLTNMSNAGSDFRWIINDTDTSTTYSTFLSLPEPGDYNICLQGTMNCHTVLTNCMTIPIKGISSYEPHVGGNSGTVSLSIAAGDPNNVDAVVLQTDAGNIIEAFNITKTGNGKLSASFNLDGQVPDQSELIVIYNNGEEYIADEGFMIELGEKSDPWLEITGHDAALLNTWSSYDIHFGNRSNVDAYGVPLWIAVSSVPDLEIEFVNVEFTQSQYSIDMGRTEDYFKDVDIFVDLDSMFGEANPTRVYPLYLQMIPANQDFTIKLRIKSSQNYELEAWLNEPYFNSPFNGRFALCVANIIAGKFIQFIPGAECANTVIGSIFKPTARLQGDNESILVVPSTHDMFNIMVDCGGSFFAGLKFAQNVINLVLNFKNDVQALIDCKKNFDPKDKKKKDINIVQSFDPNEKVGPEGYGEANYIGYQEEINYTIFFENKSDASAPAHTIIVRDTLDQTVFDLASLQLKSVSLGDKVFSLNPNSKTYAAQHMLDELGVIAQVEATVDENSGVMEWEFKSIEPSTGEEVTDPFVGILPPNILSPEGEGYVSFTVSLLNAPSHDFEFGNRASIYFDANDPIHTEAYINTFDLVEPESWIDIAEDLIINSNIIELELNAMDDGAGVDNVEIWYAVNDEAFQLWQIISPDITTIEFTGEQGNEYSFYSVAKDYVGLFEAVPGVPDASTMISNTETVDGLLSDLKIYPQPSDGIISVLGEGYKNGLYNIRIYNSIGQEIYNSMKMVNNSCIDFKLDLSSHPGGVYILNINKDKNSFSRQFIIE